MQVLLTEDDERIAGLERIAAAKDVHLPHLKYWNYDACARHTAVGPQADCEYRACGGELFAHQRVGVSWAYFAKKGLLADDPGLGKAQPLTAGVLTPEGWRKMGDLRVGNTVLTPTGHSAEVLGVFPQGVKAIYRVTLNDGSTTRATADHLWQVDTKRTTRMMTTAQLMDAGVSWQDGRLKFRLPTICLDTPGAELPADLPVDPYVFGVLLGDGSFRGANLHLSNPDAGVLKLFTSRLRGLRLAHSLSMPDIDYRVSGDGHPKGNYIRTYLRDVGLLGVKSQGKFIPERYLRAGKEARIELLRGLMDTDGYAGASAEYCSTSYRMACDVAELARSLGCYARLAHKSTSWTHNGVRKTGEAWRVVIGSQFNLFHLKRKADRWRPGQKQRRIAQIEFDGYEEAQCILVDDPAHLYVTDDMIPTHNTNVVLALLALLKQRGELNNRALLIVQTPSVRQWAREADRWCPGVNFAAITGSLSKMDRAQVYAENWDVLVIGFHVALRDEYLLETLGPFAFVASDDVDPLLDHSNATHQMIAHLSDGAERSLTLNATVLQVRLQQLHAALVPSGGLKVFGDLRRFNRDYVRTQPLTIHRNGRRIRAKQNMGYKNLNLLREKLRGMVLRRKDTDVADIRMPVLMPPSTVWLELSPRQKRAYEALQQDALMLKRDSGLTHAKAQAKFMYGQMICAGMPALGEEDSVDASPKLDWVMTHLTTVWKDRKIVVFVKNIGLVKAFEARCIRAGIGVAKVWGVQQNDIARQQEVDRFWQDPKCRVLIGTTAVERSLNLHVSNIVVCLDTHLNPARMKQILGRVKRAGSKFKHVYMFTLLMSETQEEGYENILSQRQALGDAVFGEDSEMYAKLSPMELLSLITP